MLGAFLIMCLAQLICINERRIKPVARFYRRMSSNGEERASPTTRDTSNSLAFALARLVPSFLRYCYALYQTVRK